MGSRTLQIRTSEITRSKILREGERHIMPGEGVSPTNSEGLGESPRLAKGPTKIGRLGPFRVIRLLGSGGMGSVFQAVDTQLGRFVALKVLRTRLAGSEVARQRFLREARAAAKLEHDHVVAIYQVGEDNGVPYLAMPLLHGQSLARPAPQGRPGSPSPRSCGSAARSPRDWPRPTLRG